jgi:hypothetical protein
MAISHKVGGVFIVENPNAASSSGIRVAVMSEMSWRKITSSIEVHPLVSRSDARRPARNALACVPTRCHKLDEWGAVMFDGRPLP